MTVNELAKMKLIYQYLYMTDNPNKVSQEVRKKLRYQLRRIMTYQEKLYNEATKVQEEVYREAWDNLFGKEKEVYVSLGLFMTRLYNSIDKQKLVGHKLMKRMFDSYYHCPSSANLSEQEDLDMNLNAERLGTEVLRLLDGETVSPLKRMALTIKNNLIIEGKIK